MAVCILASLPTDIQTAMKKKTIGPCSLRMRFRMLGEGSPLSKMIVGTTEEWYRAKHPRTSGDEVGLINSLSVSACPYCGSGNIKKNGKRRDGMQTYRCRGCGRKFNPLTGTVFDSRKIPISEWIEYLVHLFQYESVSVSSLDNRNSLSTGRYWMRKVFSVIKDCQKGIVLGSPFWIDETFLSRKPSELSRRKKGDRLRGLSHDKICIETATDGKRTVLAAIGYGKPSKSRVLEAMEGHVTEGSTRIDDGEEAHSVLVARYGLRRERHLSADTKGLEDSRNPMNEINRRHRYFKMFMSRHGSYGRASIQDWCNLFSFAYNRRGEVGIMVEDFLGLALKSKKVMRYRTVMGSKTDKK